jgi:hypothetical protein
MENGRIISKREPHLQRWPQCETAGGAHGAPLAGIATGISRSLSAVSIAFNKQIKSLTTRGVSSSAGVEELGGWVSTQLQGTRQSEHWPAGESSVGLMQSELPIDAALSPSIWRAARTE